MEPVRTAWKRIETWLAANAPSCLDALLPPAAGPAIEDAAAKVNARWPDDYRASLAIHEGQGGQALGLIGGWYLVPLAEVIELHAMLADLHRELDPDLDPTIVAAPGVRDVWWTPGWVPVADDHAGNHVCLDLDPAPGGSYGQLVLFLHDRPQRRLVARDFAAWLERAATWMEQGRVHTKDLGHGMVGLDYADWQTVVGPEER